MEESNRRLCHSNKNQETCFLLHRAVEERHDLRSCAGVIGAEQTVADAAGDAVLLCPSHCRCVVSVGRHIGEGCVAADSGVALGTPQEGDDLRTGAGLVGSEQAVADAVRRSRAGLQDPKKPIASFIFLGTTGTGKTELAKALAEYLFNDENMMTRIDMSEYQEKFSVSRLIGAPPGYVGYDEGGQLTEAVRRKPYSVVLFDEIEKAHPDVFNILLQVLDDGRLTDNKGRTVNFKNTIIIMTSNLGSQYIQERFADLNDYNREEVISDTRHNVMEMLKKTIRPEFLNRIDDIIMFLPLTKQEIGQVVTLQLQHVRNMLEPQGIRIEWTPDAVDWLAGVGYNPEFGARPVKRAIQEYMLNKLSKKILAEEVNREKPIVVDANANGLVFRN